MVCFFGDCSGSDLRSRRVVPRGEFIIAKIVELERRVIRRIDHIGLFAMSASHMNGNGAPVSFETIKIYQSNSYASDSNHCGLKRR